MSFGWSVGDIIKAAQILWEIGEALNSTHGSTQDRIRANEFLNSFRDAINVVGDVYGEHLPEEDSKAQQAQAAAAANLDSGTQEHLLALKHLYDEFKEEYDKYIGMNKSPDEKEIHFITRQAKKIKWEFFTKTKIQELKIRVTQQVTLLSPSITR
jgi:hypothetical protein